MADSVIKIEVEKYIKLFTSRTRLNRFFYYLSKIITIVFGGGITILLGMKISIFSIKPEDFSILLAGIITINEALTALLKLKEDWIRYLRTANLLRELKFKIEVSIENGTFSVDKAAFQSRFQDILNAQNMSYHEIREDDEKR